MYESLMCLPYFQGMSKDEITAILDKVKLVFNRHSDGERIAAQGSPCNSLTLLVRGKLTSKCVAPDGRYTLIEELTTPFAFEPYSLFGKRPSYKATYTAKSDVSLLTIDKQYIYGVLDKYEVFRMNLLNLLSNKAEQLHTHIWSISPQPLEGRLAHFVRSLCTTPHGPKTLRIKMDDLATLLDDTRLNISRVLNKWQQSGIIEMHRKEFVFHTIPTF